MKDYELYGDEWKAEMMKMCKADIIEFYKKSLIRYAWESKAAKLREAALIEVIDEGAKERYEKALDHMIKVSDGHISWLQKSNEWMEALHIASGYEDNKI